MLVNWLTRIKGWLFVAALFIGSLLSVFVYGRRKGQTDQKNKQDADNFKQHVDAEKKVNDARKDVDSMSGPDVDKRLDDWMRD